MLDALRKFLSLKPRVESDVRNLTGDQNQALFLTAGNLTFPGVAVVAGSILNFLAVNIGGNRLWIALIIALVFGGFVTWLALTDPKADQTGQGKVKGGFVGLINTVLLWISTFGVSSL